MEHNDHPALRRALRAMPGEPIAPPELLGAVQRRAAALRRRRLAGAGGVLGAVALSALAVIPGPGAPGALHPAAGPDAAVASEAPSPGADSPAPPVGPTSAPAASPESDPAASPASDPAASRAPTEVPSSPTSPDDGSEPVGPPMVKVTVDDPTPLAAATVDFYMNVYYGVAYETTIDFGDGRRRVVMPALPEGDCAEDPYRNPRSTGAGARHAYRVAGRYDVVVTTTFIRKCDEPPVVVQERVSVEVLPGREVSNGDYQPRLSVNLRGLREPVDVPGRTVRLDVRTDELDGWITRIVVDWGDGSEPTVFDYGRDGCQDTPTTFCEPNSRHEPAVEHEYADEASHDVTVTVTSTGCGGADEQTATVVRTLS